jgi:hypothetical protein
MGVLVAVSTLAANLSKKAGRSIVNPRRKNRSGVFPKFFDARPPRALAGQGIRIIFAKISYYLCENKALRVNKR